MKDLVWATLSNPLWSSLALSLKAKSNTVLVRGGFGSDRLGIGQNRCPSVENKFTDNPSVNRPLIGSGQSGRLSGFGGWMSGRWSGLIGPTNGLFWAYKWTLKIQSISLFWTFGPF